MVFSNSVSIERFKFVKKIRLTNVWFFYLHQNHDSRIIPTYASIFDLFRYSKSSLSVTAGFISSNKVAIEKFLVLKVVSGKKISFQSFRWTSVDPEFSIFFKMELSRYSISGFPITTYLRSSFKVSILSFPRKTDYSVEKF